MRFRLRVITWAMAVVLGICALQVDAAVPPIINYQGKLTGANAIPVADGTYAIRFAIYAVPTGGMPLWSETNTAVQVKDGLFSVLLGSVVNLPANIFDAPDRFFGIQVGTDPEMTPRQQIASVPFAVRAATADSATHADTASTAGMAVAVVDGAVTDGKIADGAVTTSKIADGAIGGAKLKDEPWGTYSPAWTSDGAQQPSNGMITGKFARIGSTVICTGTLAIVDNTTLGEGRWRISLPVTAKDGSNLGVARDVQYNTGNWVGFCWPMGDYLEFAGPTASTSSWEWNSNLPFIWTPGSALQWSITYEAG